MQGFKSNKHLRVDFGLCVTESPTNFIGSKNVFVNKRVSQLFSQKNELLYKKHEELCSLSKGLSKTNIVIMASVCLWSTLYPMRLKTVGQMKKSYYKLMFYYDRGTFLAI